MTRIFPLYFIPFAMLLTLTAISCQSPVAENSKAEEAKDSAFVRLITADPGHFHAALVQKSMYEGIDSVVYVYAPEGPELQAHLALVKQYNDRAEQPTHWKEQVYTGSDFFEKLLAEKKGNVLVLAGNNLRKTQYITRAIDAGIHVLADKPMAITPANFTALEKDFATAAEKKLLLYDIMTERSEITNILLKEFAELPEVFGVLQDGTPQAPAVTIESVHYFYKFVSGKALTRPSWFFDPAQQGEAIADVGTHLVDLVQWTCFPEQAIDYKSDILVNKARLWPTPISKSQFAAVTGTDTFPSFLQSYVKDTILNTHGNGAIQYRLKGKQVLLTARWDYKAPEGSGDTHYCLLKGSLANLEIKQGKEENYKPTLYIWPLKPGAGYDTALQNSMEKINSSYKGVSIEKTGKGYKVVIPDSFKVGHEAHFGQVMQRYLQYLKAGQLPAWETPGMIAKYYTTARAIEIASAGK
ncbi:MAG TPA: putative oxidoreductase C-terminal domain-containing protein [Chitinophagaceae bacterium]|nr:putative oxidoreductase C-terminal domain-containing protein [Chitinophagaceae bacterium]